MNKEPLDTHSPVLFNEVMQHLAVKVDSIYIDATYGRGGHSQGILEKLERGNLSGHGISHAPSGFLIAFDRDYDAIAAAKQRHADNPHFTIFHQSFTTIQTIAEQQQISGKVTGILCDLGVSSPQLDTASRGFSFLRDGPLDMRMDTSQGQSVAEWLTQTTEKELADVLWQYGEERFSRRIAYAIMAAQQQSPITTTKQLADIIAKANPRWEKHKNPATRCFQALRIFINNELDELKAFLTQCLSVLKVGGQLLVISFHSLEDRIVKQFIRQHSQVSQLLRGLPITDQQLQQQTTLRLKSGGKAIKPSPEEIKCNPRSRSAILRIAEKIA
ncbi:MAG: 16S rRNA (cytosine(1402)-N(4))-methyltransferase RsmH [Gammaproteobacteria bacterium]|nr:16S rRNA (cytosine(1402)-N(4))-methyltransferase RsmH [Gammaproteobacteria bacterium]